jgi:hypothetical protein
MLARGSVQASSSIPSSRGFELNERQKARGRSLNGSVAPPPAPSLAVELLWTILADPPTIRRLQIGILRLCARAAVHWLC